MVSKGLSADAIAALPSHAYIAPQMVLRSSDALAESCAVCCEDLEVHASMAALCACLPACLCHVPFSDA